MANLLSSILTILLTCPNNDTVVCYSNDPFLTVYQCNSRWHLNLGVWGPQLNTLTTRLSVYFNNVYADMSRTNNCN